MFDFGAYEEQKKTFTAKLRGGMELSGQYRVNFITSNTLQAMDSRVRYRKLQVEIEDGKTEEQLVSTTPLNQIFFEDGSSATVPVKTQTDAFEDKVDDLALQIFEFDIEEKGKPMAWPKKAEERTDKLKEILRRFDYNDLKLIEKAIQDDITGPLDETGTSSSTG